MVELLRWRVKRTAVKRKQPIFELIAYSRAFIADISACFRSISAGLAAFSVVFSFLWKFALVLFARLFPQNFAVFSFRLSAHLGLELWETLPFIPWFFILWILNSTHRRLAEFTCTAVSRYSSRGFMLHLTVKIFRLKIRGLFLQELPLFLWINRVCGFVRFSRNLARMFVGY